MSNLSNFIINDGILTKYVGTDPHVIVPEGVTQIGAEAFAVELGETSSLETVVLPSTLRVIEKYAFHSADTLKRILFPCGLKEIADGAFFKCHSLESIEIPDSVAFIGRSAFCSCRRLEEVKWYTPFAGKRFHNLGVANPAEGSTVSADAFAGCDSLTEIVLPEGIKVIGENAFYECVSLSKVTLPDSLETICDGAFAKCNSLKNITLPQNVSYVGKTAFPGLSGWGATAAVFSNIYVDPSNSAYCTNQGILYTKDRKTVVSCPAAYPAEELVIESDVTQISVSAFQGCHTIKKLVLPDTITTIGAKAFSDMADLEEVILPKNLEVLPESAFSNCEKLKRITWPKKLHTIRKCCFEY